MGELATPTPADRKRTRDYAASVVKAERDDQERPYATYADGSPMHPNVAVFDLSLEVTTLVAERDALIRKLLREGGTP